MFCKVCGNVIDDNSQYCSHCGSVVNPGLEYGLDAYTKEDGKCNTFAIVALICAILAAMNFFWKFGFITGIAALIFAFISLKQIKETKQKGRDLAIAAVIVASISLVLTLVIAIGISKLI